jgi:hypothetical protein
MMDGDWRDSASGPFHSRKWLHGSDLHEGIVCCGKFNKVRPRRVIKEVVSYLFQDCWMGKDLNTVRPRRVDGFNKQWQAGHVIQMGVR